MIKFTSIGLLVAMVIVRTLALLALMKFLAVQFGTDGFGRLSQVLALGALFSVLAGGGLTNGIVRNLAATEDRQERVRWIKAALPITAIAALGLGLVALVLYGTAASVLFPGQDLGFVLIVIAISQAIVGFGNIALAYLSGTHNVRAFTLANIIGSIAAALAIGFLAYSSGFHGAAAGCGAMALMPALAGMLIAGRTLRWTEVRNALFERERAWALAKFGGSMYVAAAAVPLVWVYVRSDLALREGWQAVGLWQSVTRISEGYMQVFGVIFMNYALPRIASSPPSERAERLRHIGVLIFALFLPGAALLYSARDVVLRVAYSRAFTDATTFLVPQIFGDGLKLVSLLFVYYLMALNRPGVLAAMEVLQAGVILFAYRILVTYLGGRAAVISYALATLVVSVATLIVVARTAGLSASRDERQSEPYPI